MLTTAHKLKFLGAAAGLAAILATYVYAGDTGEHTPIKMPKGAYALPWPNPNTKPFLAPEATASQANCGQFHTFLGSLYDSSRQTTETTASISTYERTYEAAAGEHTTLQTAEIRLAVASVRAGRVIFCAPAPKVSYFNPKS
jgi:hypothetical protein